jgi:hypothetical protein
MKKPRTAATAAPTPAGDGWTRWTTQLPPTLIWDLKVRAAQEHRPIRETLRAALEAYLEAPARRAG